METPRKAEIVICGAGIAGISAAYFLTVRQGLTDVLLVDDLPPLSLTSDKSTECYRNWWPGPGDAMVQFMNRSIDLLEELAEQSGNIFNLNRRGYLYLTADHDNLPTFIHQAEIPASLGAGQLRIHTGSPADPTYTPSLPDGFRAAPDGADLILSPHLIQKHFPYISGSTCAALHVRRAGWFSAQQLGRYLLEQALAHGARLISGRVDQIKTAAGKVKSIHLAGGACIETNCFVNAAGPQVSSIARLLGVELPVFTELHVKASYRDMLGVFPRSAPLLIWADKQRLPWSEDERLLLAEDAASSWLLNELPPGVHARPEGGPDSPIFLGLWEYRVTELLPTFPPPLDEQAPEVILRGLTTMLPALTPYLHKSPRPFLDGGYYTKTRENRPLIGPLPVEGSYIIGALSGYGLMAACAAGELLALHVSGSTLPGYAKFMDIKRYQDIAYAQLISTFDSSGQL